MAENPVRTIIRIDRSPMNAKRWCLTLSCEHEWWVTSVRAPKARVFGCAKCAPPPSSPKEPR